MRQPALQSNHLSRLDLSTISFSKAAVFFYRGCPLFFRNNRLGSCYLKRSTVHSSAVALGYCVPSGVNLAVSLHPTPPIPLRNNA